MVTNRSAERTDAETREGGDQLPCADYDVPTHECRTECEPDPNLSCASRDPLGDESRQADARQHKRQ